MTSPLRTCQQCGQPTRNKGGRCNTHRLASRGRPDQRAATRTLAGATHCTLCGGPFTPDNPATNGHITPRSKGGNLDPTNLQPECARCNYRKGNRE